MFGRYNIPIMDCKPVPSGLHKRIRPRSPKWTIKSELFHISVVIEVYYTIQ